jgi:hypothetical protein
MLGFLLVRLAKAVDRDFVASLSDLGLKPRDFGCSSSSIGGRA